MGTDGKMSPVNQTIVIRNLSVKQSRNLELKQSTQKENKCRATQTSVLPDDVGMSSDVGLTY